MEEQAHSFDICVLCALHEEASAVIEEFSTRCGVVFTRAFRGPNRLQYHQTTIRNRRGEPLSVFVTWLSGMGPIRTALDLVPLLQEIGPRFVAMTGICAGNRNTVKLGDLIIATEAYHPEEGKAMTGTDKQVVHWPEPTMAGATTPVLQYVASFDQWREAVRDLHRQLFPHGEPLLEEPAGHLGVMASSMAVRADQPFAIWTKEYHRKTIGVDMEAATFYLAMRDLPLLHGLVVKGVSDYGDSSKNDTYRDYAARASAVYMLHFIQEYVTQETMPRRDVAPSFSRTESLDVWNVPYRRNPHFTGRDELLDRLDQHLSSAVQDDPTTPRRAALTQPQAIKGLGGIGKTQIAVEYAYRSREQTRYTHTFWVNAASEQTLITSFVALAELLPSFWAKSETDQRKLVTAIRRWLEECQQRWLLIFDNADEISLIREYLPQAGNGSILLTTRAAASGSLAASIEVETMGFIEGTHLLLRRAQRLEHASDEEINQAGNIVVALDHFPLALDQAGAYIDETQCSLIDYLSVYQIHRNALLARRGGQATDYPDSVATAWSLSFEKVEQRSPAAAQLLRMLAYLSPDRIPEELLKNGAPYWPPSLQQAVGDLFTFNQMFEELLKFSLVKRLAEERMLSIHRLVQAVQMDTMEPVEQVQWAERVVRAMNDAFPHNPKDAVVWPQCIRYLEQAQACDRLIQQHQLVLTEAADLLNRTGDYLLRHASYSLAESLYQRALHIFEQRSGETHPEVAFPLIGLADLYRERGKYMEAEPLYQRALHIREQTLGLEHPEVAFPLTGLATLYREQGRLAEAEPLYQRALHIREQMLGLEHPEVAYPLHGLATLYREQGKYTKAEPLYQRALRIWEQQLGETHPEVAYPLTNLGLLYSQQGRLAEAEPLYQRALRIWEQILGPEHPKVAYPLGNLAILYAGQGKYEQAELLYERALRIWEKTLGPEHPDVASLHDALATLYAEQGKYAQAELLYQHALRIREQQLGPEHLHVAMSLNNLAEQYQQQGKLAEAEPLYQRALHIFEQRLGLEHPYVAYPLTGLAGLYREQGKYAQAEPLYQRALSIREHALELHHPETAETLYHFAALQASQGCQEEAASLYQRALAIREHVYSPQHPKIIETRERLRAVLVALGRTEEASLLNMTQPEPEKMEGGSEVQQEE